MINHGWDYPAYPVANNKLSKFVREKTLEITRGDQTTSSPIGVYEI